MFDNWEAHHREVLETFGEFVFNYDITGKNQSEGANDLCTMLKLRFQHSVTVKRRPPKIFLVGPPGSGRSTQAEEMHRIYGLVNVSLQNLAAKEAETNPAVRERIRQCLESGSEIPDDISIGLIRKRITQPDCRVNGFIVDGFPQTETQINLMKSLNIKPTLVVSLDINREECLSRLTKRRIDPLTGKMFNLDITHLLPQSEEQTNRLVPLKHDSSETYHKRFAFYESQLNMLEEAYKHCWYMLEATDTYDRVSFKLAEQVLNPPY
jgi:adenylate kinase